MGPTDTTGSRTLISGACLWGVLLLIVTVAFLAGVVVGLVL